MKKRGKNEDKREKLSEKKKENDVKRGTNENERQEREMMTVVIPKTERVIMIGTDQVVVARVVETDAPEEIVIEDLEVDLLIVIVNLVLIENDVVAPTLTEKDRRSVEDETLRLPIIDRSDLQSLRLLKLTIRLLKNLCQMINQKLFQLSLLSQRFANLDGE